jgi:hypothetical protein
LFFVAGVATRVADEVTSSVCGDGEAGNLSLSHGYSAFGRRTDGENQERGSGRV